MHPLDRDYYSAYQARSRMTAVRTKNTPTEMIVGPADNDWVRWKMLPCESSLDDVFNRYESAAGCSLPLSFKRWYSAMYTLDADCSIVRLPQNPSNHPGKELLKKIMPGIDFWDRPLELGLLPFGEECNDSGPLCFDINGSEKADDWPVRFWDHEWAFKPQEIGPILFSNFHGLLRGVTAFLNDPDESSNSCASGIQALLAADPQGAGGPGRYYWLGIAEM